MTGYPGSLQPQPAWWLVADQLQLANGSSFTAWSDISGGSADALYTASGASAVPFVLTGLGAANGHSAVRLNGSLLSSAAGYPANVNFRHVRGAEHA